MTTADEVTLNDQEEERRAFQAYMEAKATFDRALRSLVLAQEAWDRAARRARGTSCDHSIPRAVEAAQARPGWRRLNSASQVIQPPPEIMP